MTESGNTIFGFLILRNSLAPLMLVVSDPTDLVVFCGIANHYDFLVCVCAAPQSTAQFIHHLSRSQIRRLEYHPRPTPMDYQPGPDPGMADIPYDPPALHIPQTYNYSRAEMIILTILSLARVVIPNLGAYCPLAAGLLY
ncbi:hypothetical protein DSO57_1004556 [Entomophthora muscae]|uniref:Uncharacterized protein n=1 Tax=Entomophthora muscae TaxID=34485 RepID=A0ACC2SA20_9FUNG|nr:hypothetical protein DSO57_1004556 [Entomophthora muscae]